ncbi:type IV-A pilus assembly ATPase PilB [Thiotrichales bacterium 19S11-10]|nr:type IV-A pilus assembly ATPase PilB [Thiotrichales bacterium 19S11-10]MCF6806868.1 type IV-A pilus assembly ATPase PilB [Thiotrichales bacterium 19S9-11]MCF6810837.1 type IV-A pilus assembly ATPase PilB [Thiotrichales bacterium 19S9-12]
MLDAESFKGINTFLIDECSIDPRVIEKATKAFKTGHKNIISYLSEHQFLEENEFAHRAAKFFTIPLLDISLLDISQLPSEYFDENLIKRYQVIPILKRNQKLVLASYQPLNFQAIQNYRFLSRLDVTCVMVIASDLERLIEKATRFFQSQSIDETASDVLDDSFVNLSEIQFNQGQDQSDKQVVSYVNQIIYDAIKQGASDIHFEPFEKSYRIRYRLDGLLYEQMAPDYQFAKRITSRLKIMANLDIAERRLPQDGRFKLQVSKVKSIDFRVSSCPTLYGEKIVLRILDPSSSHFNIDQLGLLELQKAQYMHALSLSQGMILVTGPTGSGKTVSLYGGLSLINQMDKNLSTAEDPIEINLPGVNQVNINTKTGLTFANALRAFLRQDPDIIMIGEIRDLETAEIAIKAAQTGHLVLSTLHTNNACETISRLLSMGIASYHIASSITLVIAQRLVRKLCEHCKQKDAVSSNVLKELGFSDKQLHEALTIYKASGCKHCHHGYKGRVGVFEVLEITPEIRNLILDKADTGTLLNCAKSQQFITLREAVIEKITQGVTSLEELNRTV